MITSETYFSPENAARYFSVSQFKDFMECEDMAMAKIRGDFAQEETTALLVGSFVDAHFGRTLDLFKARHSDIFTRNGELKSEYRRAEQIIERIERDEMMMQFISGEQQKIVTGELFGYEWRGKIDSYHPGKCIVDLKIMRDFEPVYKEGHGRIPFVEAWGYDLQGFVYQALEGSGLPFVIAAATKEPVTDIGLFAVPQDQLDIAGQVIQAHIDRFASVKQGLSEPQRCGRCDWCKTTKKLAEIVDYRGI